MSVDVFVALGSNQGDRLRNLLEARRRLARLPHTKRAVMSRVYDTPALQLPDDLPQPNYLNAVVGLDTRTVDPRALLRELLRLERAMGRVRTTKWAPRVIDLDLVVFRDAQVDEPGLTVPHPGLGTRRFVLEPLAELAPNLRVPGLDRTVGQLLRVAVGR